VVQLVLFAADRRLMGELRAPPWMTVTGSALAVALVAANGVMLWPLTAA
jgi:Mn2+/Fe2+ NRAMP family transporter